MEVLRVAHIMVDDKTKFDPRFHVTLNMATKKLTGQFSLNDFVHACEKYLSVTPKIVKDYSKMNKVSMDNARERVIGELVYNYNGNVKLKESK